MIRPLQEADTAADFQTPRQPELAAFLKEEAWASQAADTGRTFVLVEDDDSACILGFYCLFMSKLSVENSFSKEQRTKYPFSTVPIACLGNVARDHRVPKEKKIGEQLMQDAILRILRTASEIGCVGIALYAMTEGLEKYYQDYGFERLAAKRTANNPSQLMFLPLADVRANLAVEPGA